MEFITNIDIQTILFCLVTFLLLSWWLRCPKNLPPGPWGWPVLGYLPNLALIAYRTGLQPAQLLNLLAKKHGSVFSMKVTGKLVIVLNNFENVKEAFNNPNICDRPQLHLEKEVGGGEGLGEASGEAWAAQRRLTGTIFRSFGVGKKSFEENISNEAESLMKEISRIQGKPVDPCHFFNNTSANVICSVVFGQRFEYSDPNFKHLMDILTENFRLTASGGLNVILPIAKYLQTSTYRAVIKNRNDVMDFLRRIVQEHREVHIRNEPSDYIDMYLDEIEQTQKFNRNFAVNYKNLPCTVGQLFIAGTETTSTTLRWAVLYMMVFPEFQHRIHRELDTVVGRNRLPRLADKAELSFTFATLLEVQRTASITPLGVPHACGNDTTLGPYYIPKGSIILPNLWAIHHDPDVWANPDEFNPERFLDENGVLQEKEELIPFTIGRRNCVGEHLAKMELYIFFTHLLHQFTFRYPDDSPSPGPSHSLLKGVNGLTHSPNTFLVEFVARD
ncbi:cytochrome P450 2J4-like [Amphiura filiformis]|uniref:cytochrome P450 2J4-like n=1 Tax=Amphiura filiformis TaxID=82378 RepID=UPI003B2210C6